ncbi:STAS-like domain-containing protein [Hoeflea sp. AS60]|uniref:STAS-like domain-containing protein n=1 Tax=Hoeflea sp. AS60 TaxID=3135780 RepID=UPI003179D155
MAVSSEGNKISIQGDLVAADCARVLAAMHNEVTAKGYRDLELDFSACTKAFSAEMVAVCVRCQKYWKDGVDVSLKLPTDPKMSRLFQNANWAHLIDIRQFEPSRFRGYTHAPTLRFATGKEQYEAVNKILEILLAALRHFRREGLRVMEWAINEITDNVINHSQSTVGGLVQVTNHRQRSEIEFVVGDAGIGVPGSLRPSRPEIRSDQEALDAAIREGVTRDKAIGQGNGLYGTWQISKKSLGSFRLLSGYAALESTERDGLQIKRRDIPFVGTLIACRIGYANDVDLEEALVFSGKKHTPVDYIDTHFQMEEDGSIIFDLAEESEGFGSRAAGDPVRRKLLNILNFADAGKVIVDLDGVMLVSSSYADEVFGKLFVELGPLEFGRRVDIKNVDKLVRGLIDKAIYQRMRQ